MQQDKDLARANFRTNSRAIRMRAGQRQAIGATMNVFAVVIFLTIILGYVLDLISNLLNLRALDPGLPAEFDGVYDRDKYRTSQEYARQRTRFGLVASTYSLGLLLPFWFLGGFPFVDQWIRGYALGEIWTGLLFVLVLIVAKSISGLPFEIYSTFVLEERFGFNKTTVATFIVDRIKGFVLACAIGGPLLALLLFFLASTGEFAWIYCWGLTVAFTLIMQIVIPTWIMPLFNKFSPIDDGELKQAIVGYAESVNFPLRSVFVIDGSRRSSKSNAFFAGLGNNKRLALYDTLIESQTVPEIVAVVAHEVGHFKRKHVVKGMIISVLHTGLLFFLLSFFIAHPPLFAAFGMEQVSGYAGLVFFGMLFSPIEMVLSVFMQILSRKHEFEADHYAATTTGAGEALVSALKKLSVHNLVNLTPHPFHVFLNYSHPPILARIEAIRAGVLEKSETT
jgi:STE24 endopeptidase